MTQRIPKDIKQVLDTYPSDARARIIEIRKLIFDLAADDESIGKITETLKWGEPAYLTEQTKSGSTIRLGYKESDRESVAIYLNCQTTLVDDIKKRYPNKLNCVGKRAVLLKLDKPLPIKILSDCLTMAMKYHTNKAARSAGLI